MCSRLSLVLLALALALLPPVALGCASDQDDDTFPDHPQLDDDDDGADDDAGDDDDDAGDDDGADDDAGDDDSAPAGTFPDFFTTNDDFFELHIGPVPSIDPATYTLTVSGLVDQPQSFTLAQLQALPQSSLPLTVECIGNSVGGAAVSNAEWSGFSLADLLAQVGVQPGAVAVQFLAADGYYASATLEQVADVGVLGVLQMNGDTLPPRHGAPLRFVLPGWYGVKHPGWVTEIVLVDTIPMDFWEVAGWDCSPPMDIDSRFFFPANHAAVTAGEPFEVGGAAWSAGRVELVELSPDDGETWVEATIVDQVEADGVWVFWSAMLTLETPGEANLRSRATDGWGHAQPDEDPVYLDGANAWPTRVVDVVD